MISPIAVKFHSSMACRQLHRAAWERAQQRILTLLANGPEARPAVIFDLDETCLDNWCYYRDLMLRGKDFPDGWHEYCLRPAFQWMASIAGATNCARMCESTGIRIICASTRDRSLLEATEETLDRVFIPYDELVLTKNKEDVFREMAQTYDILAYVGDRRADFPADPPEGRCFAIPNLVYGDIFDSEDLLK